MTRIEAARQITYVVDDTGNGRKLNADPHARVREAGEEFRHGSVLVGWHGAGGATIVSVHSYLDVWVTREDAVELAVDYMVERGWGRLLASKPDFVLMPDRHPTNP